jgi:hypothetical protein
MPVIHEKLTAVIIAQDAVKCKQIEEKMVSERKERRRFSS